MDKKNDETKDRTESARDHDDSDIIDRMQEAPSQGGASGHNLNRDIGSRDEIRQEVGDGGITRARGSDKPEEADLPRFNERN
ncbi:hypothetical protein [Sphingosinicella rhizophila]|uniref:Uncharacterized protein n=1 Tax=Sphingosinicella rhizophila TaxID=3050082 RepID=A0ABU3Q4Y2_9SPHN|nr:hypothetical protein [Sphingosinicella sp. GR2756]MDT9598471.1 hypothetical protein [Sphingosinicella sp. GR2756]